MSKQQQIQVKPKPSKRESAPTDAPTTNRKIARLWFAGGES